MYEKQGEEILEKNKNEKNKFYTFTHLKIRIKI